MTQVTNLSPWPPLLPSPPYPINWGLKLVTAPAVEPVSVTMLKAHSRIEIADDDWTVLPRYIRAGRRQLERDSNRFLVTQTWDLALDGFPMRSIPVIIPRPPLQSVVSITTIDTSGTPTVMDPATYLLDTASEPGRLGTIDTAIWPQNLRAFQPITIRFVAGYLGVARGNGITSLTQVNGTATATTLTAHGLGTGEYATVAGVTNDAGYNGTGEVLVLAANEFQYQVPAATAATATTTGTMMVSDLGVPDEGIQAICLLAAHFYENREASIVSDKRITVEDMPIGYDDLLSTFKVYYVG